MVAISSIKCILRKVFFKFKGYLKSQYRKYSITLPPAELRLMGAKFYDDHYYISSAMHEGDRFAYRLSVNENTEILEIGCSSGRSVIGLIEVAGRVKRYVGVDANERNYNWCKKYIAEKHDFCEFQHIDLYHILYNRKGKIKVDEDFRLDFSENSFDLVYLHSILTNCVDREIRIFAREYFRLLRPGGTLFLTAFCEENVPDMTENPDDYVMKCTYPLQVVRFERRYFLKMFTDAGFVVDEYDARTEIDHQSAIYLKKPLEIHHKSDPEESNEVIDFNRNSVHKHTG